MSGTESRFLVFDIAYTSGFQAPCLDAENAVVPFRICLQYADRDPTMPPMQQGAMKHYN